MEYNRFIQLIKEPARSGAESVNSLQELVNEFPYFQSAHMLLARAMKEQQHIRFEKQLKLAAAYSPDRKVLFSLLHDKKKLSESFAEKLAEEILSPFILEDIKEPEPSESLISDEEVIENPFIETKVSQTTFLQEKPIQEEEIIEESKSEEVYEPRYAKESEEFVSMETSIPVSSSQPLASEPVSTDPREVLRRRLAEILGNPGVVESESKAEAVSKPEAAVAKTESFEFNPPVVESSTPGVMEEKEEKITENSDSDRESIPSEALLDTLSNMPEPPQAVPEEVDKLKELLPEDSSKPMDAIERLGLEYAMEETLLSSLEKLPPIEPKEIIVAEQASLPEKETDERKETISVPETTEESSQARTFISWLKRLSTGEFGKVEEVHADDKPEKVTGESLNDEQESLHLRGVDPGPKANADQVDNIRKEKTPEAEASKSPTGSLSGFDSKKKELIDKFITTEPKIVPSKIEFYSPVTQAKRSIEEYDDVVSETLAKIYRQQGNNLKARFCYEKLSLFYPEKRTYFAALIKEIDEELNSSNQEDL